MATNSKDLQEWEGQLFDNPQVGFLIVDEKRIIWNVNQTLCDLFGYAQPSEIIGQSAEILHISTNTYLQFGKHIFDKTINQEPISVRFQFKKRDGSHIWTRVSGHPDKQQNLVLWTVVDITEQVRDEERLRQSETKFRLLAEHTHDCEYWVNLKGQYQYVSPACEQITGYRPEELIARPELIFEMIRPDFAEQYREHTDQKHIIDPQPCSMELPIITKEGEERWLEHRCYPMFDDGHRVIGRRGSNRNITKRKLAEKQLQNSETTLKSILHAAPVGVGLLKNRVFQWCSDNLLKMLDYFIAELMGQNSRILYENEQEYLRVGRDKYQKIERSGIGAVETRWKRKDGILIDVWLSSSPLDPRDLSKGVIFTAEDITLKKKAEQQQKELEAHLHQAQKMEAIGTLAGGIAHDFNNMLSAIIGFSEIAKMQLPSDSQAIIDIDEAIKASKHAADLVKQILTFSRKDSEAEEIIQLHLIVKDSLKMLRSSLPTTITIVEEIDSGCGQIKASVTRLHQLIMNLCTNAAHALPDEKGTITVGLQRQEVVAADITEPDIEPGAFLVLSITDDGQGMYEETLQRIFEPYFTTKEVDRGTGLGLAVVHGIVQDLHGFIRVESALGKGSTFKIYLPVAQEQAPTEPEEIDTTELPTGSERVLVVDDEASILAVNRRMLEQLGYHVTTASSGEDALALFEGNSETFDMVITDQTMLKMTGAELAAELLKLRPKLPLILCTGYSVQFSEDEAKQIGIRAFCMKPLSLKELAQITRKVLA